MSRPSMRLLALVLTFALVAVGCGDSDDSSDTAAEDDAATDETSTTTSAEGGATTTAAGGGATTTSAGGDGDDGEPGSLADATSIEDLQALWAAERRAIIDDIAANGYGIDDQNVLVGPAGFEIDLNECPADWDDTGGITDTEIRIGLSTAQSGPAAAYGDIAVGWEAQLDWMNENGGIDGRQLTLIVKDDAYVASQTIEAVDELIQSENVFTITTLGSPNTLAVYDTLHSACIPDPFVQAGHPAWGDPVNHPWTNGLQLAYNTEAALWATWIEANMADQAPVKVGALVIDNDFGVAYDEGFRTAAEGSDVIGEIVSVKHDPAAATVTNEITTITGEDPDVVIWMTGGNFCLLAIQDAGRSGLGESVAPKFMPSVCKTIEAFMAPAGDAADGYLIVGGGLKETTDPQFADDPYIAWLNEQLEAAGLDPAVGLYATGFGLFAWPYEQALRIAAELPGGLSRSNFILAIRSMSDMSNAMLLDGIEFGMYGNEDAYFIEGSEISRFDAAAQSWIVEGEPIDNNGQSGLCAWNVDEGGCG